VLEKERGGDAAPDESADAERQEAYALAERLEKEISQLGARFEEIVTRLNRSRGAASSLGAAPGAGAEESGSSLVLRILNKHFTALEWLDRSTNELRGDISTLSGLLSGSGNRARAS